MGDTRPDRPDNSDVVTTTEATRKGHAGDIQTGSVMPVGLPQQAAAGAQKTGITRRRTEMTMPRSGWIPAFAGMTVSRSGMTVPRSGMTVPRSGMTEGQPGMTRQSGMTRAVSSGVTNVKACHTCESRNPILMFRNGLSFQRKKACHSCESRNPKDMKNWFGWIPAFAGMTRQSVQGERTSKPVIPVKAGTIIPAKAGTIIPAKARTVIPAKARTVIPAKARTVIPAKAGTVIPVKARTVIPAKARTVIPAKAGIQRKIAMRDKQPCIYILSSRKNGTLYTGATSNLIQRVYQHKSDLVEGFSKKYGLHTLVYYELHESMETAITREKQIKKWKRQWKIELIEKSNPEWADLYEELV